MKTAIPRLLSTILITIIQPIPFYLAKFNMASHLKIGTFGLTRATRQNVAPPVYEFVSAWVNRTNMARDAQAFHTENDDEVDLSFSYSMHVAEQAFCVFAAFLMEQSTQRRYTDMRCWQMITDSWLNGGGKQPAGAIDNLGYIGINGITEPDSRAAMISELQQQATAGADTDPPADMDAIAVVETTSASPFWSKNPWLRCCERVAEGLTTPTLQVSIQRAWIILDTLGDYHLVVRLVQVEVQAAEPELQPAAPVVQVAGP